MTENHVNEQVITLNTVEQLPCRQDSLAMKCARMLVACVLHRHPLTLCLAVAHRDGAHLKRSSARKLMQ